MHKTRADLGAIAQLGERLLCKQEVVGSIPSGSTKSLQISSRVGAVTVLGWNDKLPSSIALFYFRKTAIETHTNRAVKTLQMICCQQTFQLSHLLVHYCRAYGSTLS